MRLRHSTIATLFDFAYLVLAANLLLALGTLPLVALALTTDTTRSWPLLALVAPLCAPALCGLFAVFAARGSQVLTGPKYPAPGAPDISEISDLGVLAAFVLVWRASARRAIPLAAAAVAALVVLGVDARAAWGRPVGALAIPVLATLMVLVVATTLHALAALAERPAARVRDVVRAGAYLAVRHWPLTLLSLAVLALLLTLFAARPAVALGLAGAPLLYVVWANSRFALRAALGPVKA